VCLLFLVSLSLSCATHVYQRVRVLIPLSNALNWHATSSFILYVQSEERKNWIVFLFFENSYIFIYFKEIEVL
jgi:hypothetical protein